MEYRNDIDGLRAVAVLAILFFHFDLSGVPGGFVGVDVFFVISGFLITALIQREVLAGNFRFGTFYLRRLRRLGPALLFTLVMTLIAGWVIVPPQQFTAIASSTLATLLSASNVYFWWHTGYFDSDAVSKPLLHTWSLAVEEQFYLVWPFLVLVGLKFLSHGLRIWSVLSIAALSLIASQLLLQNHPAAAFFLTPFRMYEFAAGAILALGALRAPREIIAECASLVGLITILYAAGNFNEDMAFPGLVALVPTFGAALMIYSGPQPVMNRVLALPPVRYVGKISYSLYLVHWPCVVYYRSLYGRPENTLEILALIGGTIAMGAVMYHLVETPFRRKSGPDYRITARALLGASGTAIIVLAMGGIVIQSKDGFPTRFPQTMITYLAQIDASKQERLILSREANCNASQTSQPIYFDMFESCLPSDRTHMIVVMGDSHAKGVYIGLRAIYPDAPIVQLTGNGCDIAKRLNGQNFCAPFLRHWQTWMADNADNIDAVIYAQSARSVLLRGQGGIESPHPALLALTMHNLRQIPPPDVPVFFFGPRAEFRPEIDVAIARSPDVQTLRNFYANATFAAERQLDRWLAQHASEIGVHYISTLDRLCDPLCPTLTDNNDLFVLDYAHWTTEGAISAVKQMVAADPTLTAIMAR